jgi:hypothetical protein
MERPLIVAGWVGAIALLGGNFPAMAENPADGVAQGRSQASFSLAQRNSNCRRIVADRPVALYYRPFMRDGSLGTLTNGDRVELLNAPSAVQGDDGFMYFQVRYPFNRRDQNVGYILTRYELGNGETRPTLGTCPIKAWW